MSCIHYYSTVKLAQERIFVVHISHTFLKLLGNANILGILYLLNLKNKNRLKASRSNRLISQPLMQWVCTQFAGRPTIHLQPKRVLTTQSTGHKEHAYIYIHIYNRFSYMQLAYCVKPQKTCSTSLRDRLVQLSPM